MQVIDESLIADIIVEFFEPKIPPNLKFNNEPYLITTEFMLGDMDIRISFDELDDGYEMSFDTKDVHGIFSTGLKNVSNSSLRLFNYIIGISIEFCKKYNTSKIVIHEPNYDYGKRLSLYKNILGRSEVKKAIGNLGYSVFVIQDKIELIRRGQ